MNLILAQAIIAAAAEEALKRRADPIDDTPPEPAPVRRADVNDDPGYVRPAHADLFELDLGSFAPSGPLNRAQRRAERRRQRGTR